MNRIASFYLRLNHWQLFLLIAALWCGSLVSAGFSSLEERLGTFFPYLAVVELFALFFAGWLWSLGKFLQSLVPQRLKMPLTLFRISVVLPPLCIPVFGLLFLTLNPGLFAFVFLLNIVAMAGEIYSWYFVSRSLALTHCTRRVQFSDYEGTLLGIWFFPIGIWFIQPKINRLYAKVSSNIPSGEDPAAEQS
jgi:hypothetical protein